MRYSNAAYTSKHTVITTNNAMIRSGVLRYCAVVCKARVKVARACWASVSQAKAVRHSF